MRKLSGLVLLLNVLFGCLPPPAMAATAQELIRRISTLPPAQRKKVLEEGARKEGQLVFYTSISVQDNPKLMAAFEKSHPYIKTNLYRGTPTSVFLRASTEAKAGRHLADVVGTAPVEMWQLKQTKLSGPYLSPELQAMPKGSYDPEGYWAAFEVTPIVLAYNTKLVKPAEVPNDYQELLNPKWKGKMSLGTEEYDWFSVMLDAMGKEKGLAYMRALAKQDLHMPGSSSRMRVQLMLAGESAIAIAARGRRVTEFKEQGAPIDFRIFEPYAGEPNSVALLARSPHPHAGILFIDWILSQEGQVALAEIPRISVRKGIKQKGRLQELFQKDFAFVNPASYGANVKELIAQFNEVFGIHGGK
ncbi:MAG TPA: extracellular solute-binding protein [Candidatus Acidoferrales bacterium]|nr:extracellular solute-binding protein [Candidatus Acidoferrales bacterium]